MIRVQLRPSTVVVAAALLLSSCGEVTLPNLTPAEVTSREVAVGSDASSPDTSSPETSSPETSSPGTSSPDTSPPTTEAAAAQSVGAGSPEPQTPSTVVVELSESQTGADAEEAEPEVSGEPPSPDNAGAMPGSDPTEQWRRDLAASGLQLPGGGTEVFPGRRLVANYGSPATSLLGVLGERSVEANLAQLEQLAEQYRTSMPVGVDSPPVVPSLEIIVSVATAEATPNDDYSKYLAKYKIRRWINAATEAGAFVILDLQPGRTDFVTQAKWFEEFLRLPNVGLALDPEWRIGPDEVHLRRVGSVDAAEVNAIVDYLVGLVHEEALPQKILVLHQFQRSMLPDRELIRTPPELAVVIHADGQGPLGSKYGTWEDLQTQPVGAEQTLWWGWKNFYDEDTPVAAPTQVNRVDPLPVLITYQ